ncbi:MAG: divergent polysaccharide deacetylase family protein [Pacificimonas sp.]|jgi:polysaccharide deacetylase 2 family uncharacterized protein YibQ|nr:divergent polysaccharide deacetylase family protein [Pacificimonas sp.]
MRAALLFLAPLAVAVGAAYAGTQLFAGLPAIKADVPGVDQSRVSAPASAPTETVASTSQEEGFTEPPPPPEPALPSGPLVAIVLTEIGTAPARDLAAIAALPGAISLAAAPRAERVSVIADAARTGGHELLASLPMEPNAYPRVDPGPLTLRVGVSPEDNVRSLEAVLDRFEDIDGVTGMMGSRFTRDRAALAPVMAALSDRELAYIDQRAVVGSVAEAEARAAGLASRTNDLFIDEPATAASIAARLRALTATAQERGWAIGYARPLPETVAALADYADAAPENGVTLVGVVRLARNLPDDE